MLLWIAVLVFVLQLGLALQERIRADDAPWWMDMVATLAVGVVLSHFFRQAFGRYLPSRTSSRLFRRADADDRADRSEPITPRMFSSRRRDPDLPWS